MKYLLFLGVMVGLMGCSEEKPSSVPKYQVYFSEELSLDFGDVGMSSEVPFSISPLDEKNETFLIFNSFYRRLDTVSFSPEKKRIVPGLAIPEEGPGSIPGFATFSYAEQGILFFTANEFYYLNDGETVKLRVSEVLGDGGKSRKSIHGYSLRNGTFQSTPFEGGFITLIIKDIESEKLSLMKYDFETFEEIPFSFDSEQLAKHRISFDLTKGTIVSNEFFPYLTFADSTLIVSYPFMNKISIIGLSDLNQSDLVNESHLFKSQRDQPEKASGFEDWEEFVETKSKWDSDVYFGSIFKLNDELFFRIVEQSQEGSPKKILELFDHSFKKVGEFDLTAIEPELKWFHMSVEGKILIQSWKDPDEDIFKYYLISVDAI